MLRSNVIEVGGTFVGAAIVTVWGYRFHAVHAGVELLDGSRWCSLEDLQAAVSHLFTTGGLSAIRVPMAGSPPLASGAGAK